MLTNIRNRLNEINDVESWLFFVNSIKNPIVNKWGARRYTSAAYLGSLSYNDLVKKTESIFKKSEKTNFIKEKNDVICKIKQLDIIEYNKHLFLVISKILHLIKSFFGGLSYKRDSVLQTLNAHIDEINNQQFISTNEPIKELLKEDVHVELNFVPKGNEIGRNVFSVNREAIQSTSEMGFLLDYPYELAVKEIKVSKKTPIENIIREFDLGKKMNHPQIVKSVACYKKESVSEGDVVEIVMEKIEGKTAYSMNKNKIYHKDLDFVKKLIEGAKEACLYLFDQEICWGDVNYENVMFCEKSGVKFLDFGYWREEKDLKKLALGLFGGAVDAISAIIYSSALYRLDENINRAGCVLFPESFIKEESFFEKSNKNIKDIKNDREKLRNYLASYFVCANETLEKEWLDTYSGTRAIIS